MNIHHVVEMLWVAPEHIDDNLCQKSSSQAGDVFSFGIILHEVIMRCEPYDETGMDVEGTHVHNT